MTTLETHLLLRGVSYAALCLLEGAFEVMNTNAGCNSSPPTLLPSLLRLLQLEIMMGLRHPNVAMLMGYSCQRGSAPLLITEYFERGSLYLCLQSKAKNVLDYSLLLRIAVETARGLAYLHSCGIVHCDLKTPNVLINDDWHAKVADFGNSVLLLNGGVREMKSRGASGANSRRQISGFTADRAKGETTAHDGNGQVKGETTATRAASVAWTAPELFAGSTPSVTADAYAFGVILFELLTRLRPFDGIAQDAVPLLVAIEGKRPSDYSGIGGFPASPPVRLEGGRAPFGLDASSRSLVSLSPGASTRSLSITGGGSKRNLTRRDTSEANLASRLKKAGRTTKANDANLMDRLKRAELNHSRRQLEVSMSAPVGSMRAVADRIDEDSKGEEEDGIEGRSSMQKLADADGNGRESIADAASMISDSLILAQAKAIRMMAMPTPAESGSNRLPALPSPSTLPIANHRLPPLGSLGPTSPQTSTNSVYSDADSCMSSKNGDIGDVGGEGEKQQTSGSTLQRDGSAKLQRIFEIQEADADAVKVFNSYPGILRETLVELMGRCVAQMPEDRPNLPTILKELDAAAASNFAHTKRAGGVVDNDGGDVLHNVNEDWLLKVRLPSSHDQGGGGGHAPSPLKSRRKSMDGSSMSLLSKTPRGGRGGSYLARKIWGIKENDLKIGPEIGRGAYGTVYEAVYQGTHVAVKQINAANQLPERVRTAFRNECSVLASLRHPNIVLFIGIVDSGAELSILTELCERGSISDMYRREGKPELSTHRPLALKLAQDMARGMAYLHGRDPPIVHGDLKSPNVLVTDAIVGKISDFGTSRVRDKIMTKQVGSPLWSAPEVLQGGRNSEASDVYAFGVIVWELLHWREPFEGLNLLKVALKVTRGSRPVFRPSAAEMIPGLHGLVVQCWNKLPESRPDFLELVEDLAAIEEDLAEGGAGE